ncbi:MAG: CPBP family intramembrane metalloprotease [Lachnospiraceae bacterium]|nr:CPBP family intramembrane metalloprotease [Lachnospiraceae bacterium]
MSEKSNTGRQTSFQKAWDVLLPYLLYYLAYNVAYLILAFLYQTTVQSFGGVYGQFMDTHAATVAGAMSGLCMLVGIFPLVPMLKEELRRRGETFGFVRTKAAHDTEAVTAAGKRCMPGRTAALTVLLALSASLGLNALLTLTGFADSSQTYQEVADRQYGVAFAVGLALYGLLSPLAEEVVFRGVIYNRLRRLYNPAVGIAVSGLFFGAFHGNLVQGVYGACLGMLMAYLYERSGRFLIPLLFHAVANLAVYTTARFAGVQEILFTPAGCAVLLGVSAGCVWVERIGNRDSE